VLTTVDLPLSITDSAAEQRVVMPPIDFYQGSFSEKIEAFEIDMIKAALQEKNLNQSQAAKALGMTERNLRYKLQKYHLK
jgi:two-component system NtrC family response regulator